MRISKLVLVGLLACIAAWGAFASEIDRLVADIAGGNEQARALARQLLPRHGVQAIPKLIPLLSHEDMAVGKTAFNMIEDLVNAAGAPGRFDDRLFATAEIMKLMEPEQPAEIKVIGMRLLPLIAPPELELDPVVALLKDQDQILREKARECLQHIGTENASQALLGAIPEADPAFALSLVYAAGRIEHPSSIEPLKHSASEHAAPEVRAAALQALAWTGDPSLVAALNVNGLPSGSRKTWVKKAGIGNTPSRYLGKFSLKPSSTLSNARP